MITWAAMSWYLCGGMGGFVVGLYLGMRQLDEALREATRLQTLALDLITKAATTPARNTTAVGGEE